MATTNFKVFNEANDSANTYNDSEYTNATQRQTGVIPGMAISRMHNKMYFQWSTMVTAIAQFLVSKGYDCMDDDIQGIQDALESVVVDDATKELYAKRDTAYSVGDTGLLIGIPAGYFLECTTAGTTAATAPTITPPVSMGDTITDGTAEWTVRQCSSIYNGVYNKKETFTTSGTFTAPYTGTYRITLQGGGGGGSGAGPMEINTAIKCCGSSGGGGGGLRFYEKLTAGTSYAYVVGAGGNGSNGSASVPVSNGSIGGTTSITIENTVYEATGGGPGGGSHSEYYAGEGGTAKINSVEIAGSRGCNGLKGLYPNTYSANSKGGNGRYGGGVGGNGGNVRNTSTFGNGSAGGDGFISFEYCDL